MATKRIKLPATLQNTPIAIWFDDEFGEYRVTVKGKPLATYYTDSRSDALATAQALRNSIAYA